MAVRPGLFFSKSPTRTSRNQTGRAHRRDAEGAEDAEISCSSKCNTRRLFTLRPLRLCGEFLDRFGEDLICKGLRRVYAKCFEKRPARGAAFTIGRLDCTQG